MTTTPAQSQNVVSIQQAIIVASQLHAQGKLANAEAILQQILRAAPNHAPALHLLGVIAHQVGKTPLAINLINKALSADTTSALYHTNIGEMYRQSGNLSQAIEHGLRATALNPNMASAHANLGIAYYDQGDFDQAEACQLRALALDSQFSASLNNMGSICKERKQNQEAISFYEKAIAASPNYAEPLNNLSAVLISDQRFAQAIEALKKALILSPNFADAFCNMGFALNGLDLYDQALQHFKRALELKPDYPAAYVGLGKVCRGKQNLTAAETFTLKAIEMDGTKPEFYDSLGGIYVEMGEPEKADMYFDKALAINPDLSSAMLGKGNLLVELGQPEEAEKLFLRARDDNTGNSRLAANFGLVLLHKVKKDDQTMVELLEASKSIDALPPSQIEYLHFALGKCYDDTGEHSLSFEHYQRGCQLKRKRISYNADEQSKSFDRMISIFDNSLIDSLRSFSNDSSLPIFVVGMPRSGTTLTEQIIASHADVHAAGELRHFLDLSNQPARTENNINLFFPENMTLLKGDEFAHIANEYIKRLRRYSDTAKHITDKMPNNFMALGLIHALLPNAKIIHVERNPFDTCLSCFTRLFQHGQFFSYDLTELGRYYADYRRLMKHWRNVLPENAFLDVRYEDLVNDIEAQTRRILDFCDLPWDPNCLEFYKMERQVRTASVTQVRQPIYKTSVERWRRFEGHLQPLADSLGQPLK